MNLIEHIEQLPLFTQLYRSIRELPDEVIDTLDKPELARFIKSMDIRPELLGKCGVVSQLNIYQSAVMITGVVPETNSIGFRLKNPQALQNDIRLTPASNTSCIRTEISQYIRNKDRVSLRPHKGDYQFSPNVLDFLVTIYDPTINLGNAIVSPYQKSLLLEVTEAEVYEYPIGNLLSKVTPIIKEAYLID